MSTVFPRKFPEFSSTDIFYHNIFRQNSRRGRNIKLTPQRFGINRHIDGEVAFAAIKFWWIVGHLTEISTQDFVDLTSELLLSLVSTLEGGFGYSKVTCFGSIFSIENGIWDIPTVIGSGIASRAPAFSRYCGLAHPPCSGWRDLALSI